MVEKDNRPDEESAANIATRYLINPTEDKLVEVSYLPQGVVHSLTMLQAFEQQFTNFVDQIRAVQLWYLRREARRKGHDDEWVETEHKKYEKTDLVDLRNLFIHRFRHAFYQTSRGRDGKFVESLVIISDTDLQTRSPDLESPFKHMREQ